MARFTKSLAALEETPTQQEISQKKKAERERAERERIAKLSAEEQRKYVEKERKGNMKSKSVFSAADFRNAKGEERLRFRCKYYCRLF